MKQKFKLKTKIGQPVYYIEINIRSEVDKHKDSCINKDGVHILERKIVYQTYYKIALNDRWITTLDRAKVGDRKSDTWHYLEDMCVSIKTKETYWANGIFGSMHTLGDPQKAIKKLTKEMQRVADKEYGFLFNLDIESKVNEYLD